MTTSFWLGLIGDSFTFLGGLILALDALGKERENVGIHKLTKTITSPLLAKVLLERDGISLRSESDVEMLFIKRSVRRATWGSIILAFGFVFLLLTRLCEIWTGG